jgi:hypothetical protein
LAGAQGRRGGAAFADSSAGRSIVWQIQASLREIGLGASRETALRVLGGPISAYQMADSHEPCALRGYAVHAARVTSICLAGLRPGVAIVICT